MVGLGLGHWLTRGMGAPPPLKPTPMGYGGAWVGGLGFGLAIESPPCHLTSPLACPTPGFKPTPMGSRPKPTPKQKPSGWCLGRFTPTHTQTPRPNTMAGRRMAPPFHLLGRWRPRGAIEAEVAGGDKPHPPVLHYNTIKRMIDINMNL
ncbi:hypothetical protein Hanom_Chr05g00452881 [Helianthus anomalus]